MAERGRRILIDGSMAKRGGGFTYLVNILSHLSRLAPNDEFRVVIGDERLSQSIPPAGNLEVVYLGSLSLLDRLRFTYLRAPRMAAEWKADLYFSAGEMAPLTAPCPTIAAFRNPNLFYPGSARDLPLFQKLRLTALNGLARLSTKACDRIMFVSRDSANWIGDMLGLPDEQRSVVHHGIDAEPWAAERGHGALPATGAPYILSVSSIYSYKNYVRLIEAWAELAERRHDLPDLVIIGDNQDPATAEQMEVAREATGDLSERIHILGEVPYSEIRSHYRNASLFVFPSYLETFGHPLLEAMASDTPLVASDLPVFREIAGDAAFYADPFDSSALARAMDEALYQPGAAEALVKRGRERLKHFTWQHSAETLLAMFRSVLGEQKLRNFAAQPVHGGIQSAPATVGFGTRAAADALRGH